MGKCLICDKPRKKGNLKCKLCGMAIENANISCKGFFFCCDYCKEKFHHIFLNSNDSEKQKILEKDIIM